MIRAAFTPDLWHVGELPGDRGRIVRDENGLRVAELADWRAAQRLIRRHNRQELGRLRAARAA